MNFEILGPLRVVNGDGEPVALGGEKPAALLAMLLLRTGEVVSTDRLIDDLWQGAPPATAAKTLQVYVSRLRRLLGQSDSGERVLETTRNGYVLRVDGDSIDSLQFERLLSEGNAALAAGRHAEAARTLRSALALWRGNVLADFAYADFAQSAIARLEAQRVVALESALEAELALGRDREVIPELESLVATHPLSERLRAQLMLALYRAGRQADALEVYRSGRRTLVEQLGIEPGAELRELERAILAQDPKLVSARARDVRPSPPRNPARSLLVGYEHELTALEDALEDTLAGRGQLALIAGEPGIGKTRLAEELADVARARGAEVLWARNSEPGRAPAYWPWTQILRAAPALPELQDLVPDGADTEELRFRLFDAVATCLRREASDKPLVLVVDDAHDADEPSLALLQFLAGSIADSRVLIVVTYRDTELGPGHPLRGALAELGRTCDCTRLALRGLSLEDTAHFVEVSAGVAPMPVLATALHDTTRGNPLFVSEIVRLLRAEDRLRELESDVRLAVPGGVRDAILRRLQRLSEPCRRTLELASVIGPEFEVWLLDAVADGGSEDLLQQLDEAAVAGLISQGADGNMRFSHDLMRTALYQALGSGERCRMHLAVADALERSARSPGERELPRLAHHFAEALPLGDASKAVDYLVRAGDYTADLVAYEEASRLYERALDIAARDGRTDPALIRDVLVKLAEQLVVGGPRARAEAALDQAEAMNAEAGDRALAARIITARAHLDLFDVCELPADRVQAIIDLFQEMDDPFAEARGWWALVRAYHGHGEMDLAAQAAERALDCARKVGSQALISRALYGLASATARGYVPVAEAIPRLRALRPISPHARCEARLLIHLAELETWRGRPDVARALVDEAHALAPSSGGNDYTLQTLGVQARIALVAGNPQAAEALARENCAELERLELTSYLRSELGDLVDALTGQGRLDEASEELERAAAIEMPDEDVDAIYRQARARARIQLARGDVPGAEASARVAVENVAKTGMPDQYANVLTLLALVLVAANREPEARAAAEQALELADRKGHVVYAQTARELLGAMSPVSVA